MSGRRIGRGAREVRSAKQLAQLSARERETYERVLIATMLTQRGYTASEAAREVGTTPETMLRYAGSAFERGRDGRIRPRPANRLYRRVAVLTPEGVEFVGIGGSRRASLAARHAAAVDRYVETGDERPLARFSGKRVGGVELVSDPDQIDELARRGVLEFEQFYNLR